MAKAIVRRNGLPKARRPGGDERPAIPRPVPDFGSIMTQFNDALALIVLCQRSLVNVDNGVFEEAVLRQAIELMRRVYEEIDQADFNLRCAEVD
jgi:hypothetical protein